MNVPTRKYLLLIVFMLAVKTGYAQLSSGAYFFDNQPQIGLYNPASHIHNDFYISVPGMGMTGFSVGNNAISVRDIIYKKDAESVSFLLNQTETDKFYNRLRSNNTYWSNARIGLFDAGVKLHRSYLSLHLAQRADVYVNIPADLYKLLIYGTTDFVSNKFDMSSTQADASSFTELSVGYAYDFTNRLQIGGALKLLVGNYNMSVENKSIYGNAGVEGWDLKARGTWYSSGAQSFLFSSNFQKVTGVFPQRLSAYYVLAGKGLSVDIGMQYRISPDLRVSASVLDLGFISWSKNAFAYNYNVDYVFDGISQLNSNSKISDFQTIGDQIRNSSFVDSLKYGFEHAKEVTVSKNAYIKRLNGQAYAGAEYNFQNGMTAACIFHATMYGENLVYEITPVVSYKPNSLLNSSLSYSIMQGRLSSVGAALSLTIGKVNVFLSSDYIPFTKLTIHSDDISFPVPYSTNAFNFSLGANLLFDFANNGLTHRKKRFSFSRLFQLDSGKGSQSDFYNSVNDKKIRKTNKKGTHPSSSDKDCNCNND